MITTTLLLFTMAFGGIVFLLIWLRGFFAGNTEEDEVKAESESQSSKSKSKSKKLPKHSFTKTKKNFEHELLHTSLKGHSGNVLSVHFSINGKYFASAADDRTVRLWSVKDFGIGNKCVRVNVDLDHGKHVHFSPDSRAFIVGLSQGNTVRVFKLTKRDDGTTLCSPLEEDFKEECKEELLSVGVGSTSTGGSFVMTAYKDTTIIIRSLKGDVFQTLNTNFGNNYSAAVSPCGRYVGASGWAPDVKIWEVKFTRNGEFKEVVRAFELKGHKSSVWSFDFNNDSSRMLTISKDGMWRFFDTEIEHEKGQEPCLLSKGNINVCGVSVAEHFCHCALSFDGKVGAIGALNSVCMFSPRTSEIGAEIKEAHSELLSALSFDISGRYLISAGDKHIHVFNNILGYKESINELEEKISKLPASATRERLEERKKKLKEELEKALERPKKDRKGSSS